MVTSFKHVVRVNRKDVACARGGCSDCPISRRLARSLQTRFRRWGRVEVRVGTVTARIWHKDPTTGASRHYHCRLPPEAQKLIRVYDRRHFAPYKLPDPVKFEVEFELSGFQFRYPNI